MSDSSQRTPAGGIRFLKVAVRYRLTTGVRRLLSFWTAVMTAAAVAVSLEMSLPIGRWLKTWGGGGSRMHVGIALLLLAGGTMLFKPFLLQAMRGVAHEASLLLPMTHRQRFVGDLAAVALFDLPPGVLFAIFVAAAAPTTGLAIHDGVMALALFAGMAVLQTLGLDRRGAREALFPWFLVTVSAVVGFAQNVVPFVGSMASLFLLLAAIDGAAASAADPVDLQLPLTKRGARKSGGGPLRHESRTIWRGGGSGLLYAAGWGAIVDGAGWLAARNNGVSSPASLGRIQSFFGCLALVIVITRIARARRAARRFRELEYVLPLSVIRRFAFVAGAAMPYSAVVLLVTMVVWRGSLTWLLAVLALEVATFFLLLVVAECDLVSGGSGETPIIGWGAAAAIGGAISPPAAAVATGVAFSVGLAALVRRTWSSDVLLEEEE
jgi:hypothetical protein